MEILTDDERRLVTDTPEVGFLADFEKWAALKTDAPSYMIKAAGFMALSLAAGDTVVLPNFFGSPVHMNLYILIVGPSTTMRKSTVLGMVKEILPKNLTTGQTYISTMDDVSVQAFNKVAGSQGATMAPIFMSVDEVAGLFQNIRRQNSYLVGFDKTLMRAYDHSAIYINRVDSEVVAPAGAFINIFAASTPEPLMDVLSAEDVASGLLPRFLIFDASQAIRGRYVPLKQRMEDQDRWEKEADELRKALSAVAYDRAMGIPLGIDDNGTAIFKVTTLPLSEDALDRLGAIDEVWSREASKDTTDWAAIKGRGFWHLVKLAGLYAISRDGKDAEVQLIDVLRAAWLVEVTIGDLDKMRKTLGSNQLERRIMEALDLMTLAGGTIGQASIARQMKLSARELIELRTTMDVRGLVLVDESTNKWRKP